ncbi:hypothetical protein K8O68_04580 [Salipaludibacillus sp. CUR1]|uniref:hypothetical protein n=1 Tax=Salipaludibacillus sp. CUR1 TaxID=2820003 RepID=UPI001E501743|nr:hypothetical protein [Salipaludibacillus sp. CUR1]MCE7791705.1 hypothetical protein [Salipaludibacillus sp. CUR1]
MRVTNGKYSKRMDDMGYRNWVDEDESPADRRQFENLLRWNIAHKNYPLLKPCISIDRAYDPESEQLDYTIDLYGDKRVVKHG